MTDCDIDDIIGWLRKLHGAQTVSRPPNEAKLYDYHYGIAKTEYNFNAKNAAVYANVYVDSLKTMLPADAAQKAYDAVHPVPNPEMSEKDVPQWLQQYGISAATEATAAAAAKAATAVATDPDATDPDDDDLRV
jgi:hypothetical protein